MSNYNPNYYKREGEGSPPYSREDSFEDPNAHPEQQSRGIPGDTLQLPGAKPSGLSVSPPSSSTAYTPYYAGASPTSSPVNTKANPPSPNAGEKNAYKAYRPPVQQAYSTDSVIPSQPHGPYTAYQPPKPITTTQAIPNIASQRPLASPAISPLMQPVGHIDNRPVSPPAQRLPSPLPTSQLAENKPAAAAANYIPPSVSDSIVSTPSIYEHPQSFSAKTTTQQPATSGPFTPQGGAYQQQPQVQQVPAYIPPKPTNVIPTHVVPSYAPPVPLGTTPQGGDFTASPPQHSGSLPSTGAQLDHQTSHTKFPTQPADTVGQGYVDPNYRPLNQPAKPQQPSPYGEQHQQTAPYNDQHQQPPQYGEQHQQTTSYNDQHQQPPQYGEKHQQPSSYTSQPQQPSSYAEQYQQPSSYTAQPQQSSPYPPTPGGLTNMPSFPPGQAYAVELPSSPDGPNLPPKPSKQLSFTLPPSDIYAERIANFMNMLEKEASLAPTAAPTLGQPEPEDLETRRHRVFRDWIVSEAKLRGPKFATDLADDLDSLSFGSTRASGQFKVKPRGSDDVYGYAGEKSRQAPISHQPLPRVTNVDVSKLLPLLYPPPPPKVTAASQLSPFQKTFATAANLSFIEKNRQSFVAQQNEIERKIQSDIDEIRRRRGKRDPQGAENLIHELRKREGADMYERFDRDVVNPTYGELMKTGEVIETVKQGVEDFVKDNAATLSTSELLEIFSFLAAVQDFSTTVHNQMESILTERSMKYMYSLTVPLYEANDAAEAKKIEAWNQGVVAGQVADNKQSEQKRVAKYTKSILEVCDQSISKEKAKAAQLTSTLSELVRAVDGGLRDGGRIEFNIPQGEDMRPYDLSEEGKLLWLRSKILTAALALQASMDSQKALQKTKDLVSRLSIKAGYAAQEADAVKQHPTNQQKNIEDINKLREQQAREIEELNRSEELESEARGVERGRFEAIVRPAADNLKAQALATGGERAQNWLKDGREETLLGWAR